MKILKILSFSIFVFIGILGLNTVYYLSVGQYTTINKINKNKEINLYEKLSILSLHSEIYTLGYLYNSDAAWANFKMLTTKEDTVYLHSNKWLSPKIINRFANNNLGKMAWNGNVDYAITSPEKNAAILLNYCNLDIQNINGKECYTATCKYTWKQTSKTVFDLKFCKVTIFEQLFFELEKQNILHPYTLICYYEK